MNQHRCQSCGMPIESGSYCHHCVDEQGNLQVFDERLSRMIQWMRHQDPALSPEGAEAKTLAYMATMPAWKDHPRIVASAQRTLASS